MPAPRVQNAPQPGATKSAPKDSLVELVRLVVNRILESGPKSTSRLSSGANEEILYETEFDGARYLLVRVKALNSSKACLSPREQEIVRMVAEGHPNKTIADVLNISAWTVCTHLRRIFAKFGVASRAAMVARFLERDSSSGWSASMAPPFDIFRLEKDGAPVWCDVANTPEIAKVRVRTLMGSVPTQYVVVSKATGQRIIFGSSAASIAKPPASVTPSSYQICRIDKQRLRRVESVESLRNAEARIKALKALSPGEYFVLDYDPEARDSVLPWAPLSVMLMIFLNQVVVHIQ